MATVRDRGWSYFDAIFAGAPLREVSPWVREGGHAAYQPDFDALEHLPGVPVLLKVTSQSGVPALALDVWVSYEFRRSGFDPDRVWPRASVCHELSVSFYSDPVRRQLSDLGMTYGMFFEQDMYA